MTNNSTDTTHKQHLATCYHIILDAARKKRLREEKQTTVRGKFGDQTRTAEVGATTEKPSAIIV